MKRIIIKGRFKIEGDLPYLDKTSQIFNFVEIELHQEPCFRMTQFSSVDKKLLDEIEFLQNIKDGRYNKAQSKKEAEQ